MNQMMVNIDKMMNTDITTDRVMAEPGTDRGQPLLPPGLLARLLTQCLLVDLAAATHRQGLAR
jgi:hypothetical protein